MAREYKSFLLNFHERAAKVFPERVGTYSRAID